VSTIPEVRVLQGPSTSGLPFPPELNDSVGLTDPEELRYRLGAQAVAREILPCIDTRATHWRYYLLAAPAAGKGRPIVIGRRLLSVLKQTASRAGIGRRDLDRVLRDGRRSEARFVDLLERRYDSAYQSAASAFWGAGGELATGYPGDPSPALVGAARDYVLAEDYRAFFESVERPDRLAHLFRSRLVRFRPGLSEYLIALRGDLVKAAAGAASSRKLDDDDRLLFLAWSLLQAYYGIADDGTALDAEDEAEDPASSDGDAYYRALAKASLELLESVDLSKSLTNKQRVTIRERLHTAVTHKGEYEPPVRVWSLRTDGSKRRVFASLRLFAFARILRATGAYRA
jgi:hypothetical protein